jgi:CxxC-x17-CxxC domain-containing protein
MNVKFHLFQQLTNQFIAMIVLDKINHKMTEVQDIPEMTEVQDIPEMTEVQDIPEMTEVQDIPEMRFSAKCDNCGDDCDLPFKPKFDRPVYCSECFAKTKLKEEEYEEDDWSRNDRSIKPRETFRDKPKKLKSLKKMESFYSGGSEKFYNTLKEKLFEILGGKVCSSCGFKDEKALGFKNTVDDSFDSIQRGGFASSWGKYISDPSLAKEDLKILCLNCNAVQKPISSPEPKPKNLKKKKKRFPR